VPGEKDRAFLPDEANAVLIYCSAYDRWLIAEEHLTVEGLVLQTPEGSHKANPYVKISRDAKLEIHRFLAQFGISPASRTRVHATPPEQPADPMDKYR
jgi:P27 family predicted phage terminase small subunit